MLAPHLQKPCSRASIKSKIPLLVTSVGGVTVKYDPSVNSFSFVTGTTGDTSTIKVKGAARFGLEDVPLGVGTVPKIYNLVQATNEQGCCALC